MSNTELLCYWLAIGAYALSFLLQLISTVFDKIKMGAFGTATLLGGVVFHTSFIIVRWAVQGHLPIVSVFELVGFGSLIAVWIYSAVLIKTSQKGIGFVIVPAVFITLGIMLFANTDPTTITQGFNSIWLYLHVIFALLSYGCFLCAAGTGCMYLLKERKDKEDASLESLDLLGYRFVMTGFVASAIFIATGAVWAFFLWGRYWGWDPVESASLLTWLLYGLYLHLRFKKAWKGKRSAWIAIICFAIVIVVFWVIPFSGISVHVYEGM